MTLAPQLPLELSRVPRVDAVGVEERAAAFAKRSIKKESKRAGIRLAISRIDLTTLEEACGAAHLQVIVETGELATHSRILHRL